MQKIINENDGENYLFQKYKERFEDRNNFKLEIKCFNKCGSIYSQKVLFSMNLDHCSSCWLSLDHWSFFAGR